jgi:hypothetical protein
MRDRDSCLAGWRVRSNFPIAGLAPWTGEERSPDVVVRSGPIPKRAAGLLLDGPLLQISRDSSCWFTTPPAAFFVNSDGTDVIVDADDPAGGAVRAFLLRGVFAILCHKRDLLPIHASCVEVGGRAAAAFAGCSGAGKSVLAAAFIKAGCSILADDITAVDANAPGGPVVWPSFPQLKLWRDSLHVLGFEGVCYSRCRAEIEKYEIPSGGAFTTNPVRLGALFHLRRDRKAEGCSIQLGDRRLRDAADAIAYGEAAGMLSGRSSGLQSIARLCAATPAYSLAYRPGFDALPATVAAIRAKHSEPS